MNDGVKDSEPQYQDPLLNKVNEVLGDAEDEESENESPIGLHVFYTYEEMNTFLSAILKEVKTAF